MLLEPASLFLAHTNQDIWQRIRSLLAGSLRETDVRGWYKTGTTIGIIFTEVGSAEGASVGNALAVRIRVLLSEKFGDEQANQIRLSFYVFPDDWDKYANDRSAAATLYPNPAQDKRASLVIKRSIDVAGSLLALLLASPLFFAIALIVKLTSKGPALFRQERVGQYGRKFTFLKFRSMYLNNDHTIHREFVNHLIEGARNSPHSPGECHTAYKLTNDPRITRVGKFLRKTSLDELPQLFNVLAGEMSLVGPRPPLPYEVDRYDIWHRRRLLAVKPGLTGLWQVTGRSRTTFDEMVRLDLRYAQSWSLWLDLKILIQTPWAVVAGDGAY
jgi:exopolysaccharide biosynthesis polyprenyl glycosylphosphotransferase